MRYIHTCFALLLLFVLPNHSSKAQSSSERLLSPKEFLGYELGDYFTPHHQMIDYAKHTSQNSKKIKLVEYGKTYEGRPLIAAFISSEENIKNLEQIRKNNLIATGLLKESAIGKQLPIVWLSYNIHGNEASGMEAAMMMLYKMASSENEEVKNWLNELVIVIDPCENPDGRDRYANWYRQKQGIFKNNAPENWDHNEPWPGGRFNHYLFDLNRDWLWQTQMETQQRIKLYQSYMPQIHVDLHEMGYNSPYFFAPAAKPYHEDITVWQRKFQEYIGENHARYFQKNQQLYYTKEVYDLFYPSYGDTYPTFNGAIGFTYEQGGGGSAGLSIKTNAGNTLTLQQRLFNHYTTSYSTVEVAFRYKEQLLKEFNDYFKSGNTNSVYKSFVIKYKNQEGNVASMLKLLDNQKISYGNPSSEGRKATGFDYQKNKDNSFQIDKEDIIVNIDQPQSHLIKIIFEPKSNLEDSLTYDVTAWALPYVYGTEVYALKEKIALSDQKTTNDFIPMVIPDSLNLPYAYIASWKDALDVRLLSELIKAEITIRYSELPFKIGNQVYERGTLIMNRPDNALNGNQFDAKIIKIANELKKTIIPLQTGLVNEGKDFGSEYVTVIQKPKIALVSGNDISPTNFGEIWHYFEQELNYPISVLQMEELNATDLQKYNTIILVRGQYGNGFQSKITDFVTNGGKVIAIGANAINIFANSSLSLLNKQKLLAEQEKKPEKDSTKSSKLLVRYENSSRLDIEKGIPGAIYRIELDNSHPLAFGKTDYTFVMKNDAAVFPYLPGGGWNVGIYGNDSHVSGFAGYKAKEKIKNTLAIGIEKIGDGQVIYFVDSPIFRGFWQSGKLLLGNAVFLIK